jgi:hypothetical protein
MFENILDIIKKEEILSLHPIQQDVLSHREKQADRIQRLDEALQNAQRHYRQATVTFQTEEGVKQVTATIWAMTDRNIVFKGGITIPVCSILDVQLR